MKIDNTKLENAIRQFVSNDFTFHTISGGKILALKQDFFEPEGNVFGEEKGWGGENKDKVINELVDAIKWDLENRPQKIRKDILNKIESYA